MDFAPAEEVRLLAESLGRFLADRHPLALRHAAAARPEGHDPALWRELAGLGAAGALFPEAAGGYGGTGEHIAAVFEAAGGALYAGPLLATLLGGSVLAGAGRPDLLGPVIAGERLVALAALEPGSRYEFGEVATRADAAGRLSGAKAVVAWGGEAELLVVTARDPAGRPGLFLVEAGAAGLARRSVAAIDGGRVAEITFDGTPALLLAPEAEPLLGDAVAAGLLGLAAEALGAMEVARDITLGYMGTRKQFGVPIGSFQALQHRMADVMIDIEQMRSALINAVAAFGGERRARDRALSAAKYMAGKVGRRVAEEAIQIHGGMGMTWDYPVGHYAKRLVMIDHWLGDASEHLERYAGTEEG